MQSRLPKEAGGVSGMPEKQVSYSIKLCNVCPFFVCDMLGAKCYNAERDFQNIPKYTDIQIPDWCPLPEAGGRE